MANGTIAASQLEMLSQSGTGIITITPPATNTNRAITLPDAAGAIVVSGTTPSLNGITFPATAVPSADANTLDDYEEGTWTGTLTATTTGPTTPVTATGTYTKLGRIVTVNINFDNKNTTGASGTMRISGLPFTPSGVFTGGAQLLGFTVVGTLNSYTSGAFIYFIGSGTTFTDVAIVAGAGKYVYATVVYEV